MVSSAGKIVFVSHTVENILGHHQVSYLRTINKAFILKY
jgi:hypothetical protein